MRILLLLLTIPGFLSASVFSSMGLGEYRRYGNASERGMGGVGVFTIPSYYNLDATFLVDFSRIKDKNNIKDENSFSISNVNYFIPLPDGYGMGLSLSNALLTTFYIESGDNHIGDIIYERRVSGEGGINEVYLSLYKKLSRYSLGISGIFSFGKIEEIWETTFPCGYDETVDTLIDTSSDYGLSLNFTYSQKRTTLSMGYAHYINSIYMPQKFFISFIYNTGDWQFGTKIDTEIWKKFSNGINLGLGTRRDLGWLSLSGGVFSRKWYYRDILEAGVTLGTDVTYPDGIGKFCLGLEVGKRDWKDIKEEFVRLSFTLLGMEIW